jgi:hypothetical protein
MYALCILLIFLQACGQYTSPESPVEKDTLNLHDQIPEEDFAGILNPAGAGIRERFRPPEGFERIDAADSSFAGYLRQLPLKPHGSPVLLHTGKRKAIQSVHEAVVDMDIGTKDLHQCADAIMRLRAEYLWEQQRYNEIHFNFTNGFRVDYPEWMKGKRIAVSGNRTSWVQREEPSNTYRDFWQYMEVIFMYAGTLSLSQELVPVSVSDMQPGDVFIQGGSPGHAVIVVDMALHAVTGQKVFLLAQSYMPAQEIHLLKNQGDPSISPWYASDFGQQLKTPEWTFKKTDLKRFAGE